MFEIFAKEIYGHHCYSCIAAGAKHENAFQMVTKLE